ncbi:MAG: terminase small subunit [Sphingomonadales bacterium]
MSTEPKPLSPRPLSPRHERFVLEYLKDGNATQAYLRAGYAARGAQQSASKLLRDPRIEAAIAAGRERTAQALEVDVQRIAREYAKIAFASVDDYVTTGADGLLHVDLEKANQAQRAGIVEVRIRNHSKQQQSVTLRLGKLQALAMLVKQIGLLVEKPKPGLTPADRAAFEEDRAAYRRVLQHKDEQQKQLYKELHETRQALAAARAALDAADLIMPAPDEAPAQPEAPQPEPEPQIVLSGLGPADPPRARRQRAVAPGMPTGPQPDFRPGLHPNARFIFSGGRQHRLGPDSADALRAMQPGGFDPPGPGTPGEDSAQALESWIRGG